MSAPNNRLEYHIAWIVGNVVSCKTATKEIKSSVKMLLMIPNTKRIVDMMMLKLCRGMEDLLDMEPPCSFGYVDKLTTSKDVLNKGKNKEGDVSNGILKIENWIA